LPNSIHVPKRRRCLLPGCCDAGIAKINRIPRERDEPSTQWS
jgi:hypothetical protein